MRVQERQAVQRGPSLPALVWFVSQTGTGDGYLAKVNANQRLYTTSITIDENLAATKDGRSYNVNTGTITLTDAVDTPIIYMKNNEVEAAQFKKLSRRIEDYSRKTTINMLIKAADLFGIKIQKGLEKYRQ